MLAAVRVARSHLQSVLPHVASFHLRQVSLTRAEDSGLFRYFYRVEFADPNGLSASGSDRLECVVFLDGATLDPQPLHK